MHRSFWAQIRLFMLQTRLSTVLRSMGRSLLAWRWNYFVALGLLTLLASYGMTKAAHADGAIDEASCSYNGIPLYGDVQIVESFPDLTVKVVDAFPDLRVQVVDSFPDRCGMWHYTNSFPDFTIKFVDSFPDLEIKFVNSFPGVD